MNILPCSKVISLAFFLLVIGISQAAMADRIPFPIDDSRINKSVKSLRTLQTENIVMQQLDYSCGAASLATLMRYYFNEDVTEADLLETAKSVIGVSEGQLKEKGLSLLDLKKIAEHYGFRAQGFKLKKEQLKLLKGPVLIFFKPFGYEHFAVLKGVKGDRVYIADPSRGHYRDAIYRFTKEWTGITLVLDKESTLHEDSSLSLKTIERIQPERLSIQRLWQAGDLVK